MRRQCPGVVPAGVEDETIAVNSVQDLSKPTVNIISSPQQWPIYQHTARSYRYCLVLC